jgi:gluconate 2-dehydrogenase gamma chain
MPVLNSRVAVAIPRPVRYLNGRTIAKDAMQNDDGLSRRSFLLAATGGLSAAWLTFTWAEVANAAHDAHTTVQTADASRTSFLTSIEAADVSAIASQIIPSDATPGAREAGVVFFIDRALATFFSRMAATFRTQLAEFGVACRTHHPSVASFAALSSQQQIEFLETVDHTPFFDSMRFLTVLGMFATPGYGGNRDGVGWKLLGFEDQHVFQPPFGYYDRDYPGFIIEPVKPA